MAFDIFVEVREVDRALALAMLVSAPGQIRGDADMHAAAIAVGHDVNPSALFNARPDAERWAGRKAKPRVKHGATGRDR